MGSVHNAQHGKDDTGEIVAVLLLEVVEARDLHDDRGVGKYRGRRNNLDLVTDCKVILRLPRFHNAVELRQRVAAVVVRVVAVQVVEVGCYGVRQRGRNEHCVNVNVAGDIVRQRVPAHPDRAGGGRQLTTTEGNAVMRRHSVSLQKLSAIVPTDGVIPRCLRILCRNNKVFEDVGKLLIPADEGKHLIDSGGLDGRVDQTGSDGVFCCAVLADGLGVQDRAVVVLERDGAGADHLIVGHGQIEEPRHDGGQLSLRHDRDMCCALEGEFRSGVARLVQTGKVFQAKQHVGVVHRPVHVRQAATTEACRRAHERVGVDCCGVLDPDRAEIGAVHSKRGQVRELPGNQAVQRAELGRLDRSTQREGHAGNAAAGQQKRFQGGEGGQVKCLLQLRRSAQVEVFEQRVCADADRRQVLVRVAVCLRACGEAAQTACALKVDELAVQTGNGTDLNHIGSEVDIDFRVAQRLLNGADDLICRASFRALTDAVGAVFDDDIAVGIRGDGEVAGRRDTRPLVRGVASELNFIVHGHRAVILGGHIALLVCLELGTLVGLVALHHVNVRGVAVVDIGHEVFAPHIFGHQRFRARRLMRGKFGKDAFGAPRTRRLSVLEHGFQLCAKAVTDIAPEHRGRGVEYRLGAHAVGVFKAVAEGQTAFVVVAVCGIVIVVLADVPAVVLHVRIVLIGDENVLGTVVDHAVALGEQVVVKQAVHGEVVADLGLELRRAVLLRVVRVGRPVVGHGRAKRVTGRSGGIGGNHPRQHGLECCLHLCGGFFGIAELKGTVAVPRLGGEVSRLEQALAGNVVGNLDAALKRTFAGLTEHCKVLFAVVHVAVAIQDRSACADRPCADAHGVCAGVGEEYGAGVALDGITDAGVSTAAFGQEGLEVVVVISQNSVVRILAGRHIQLDIEVRHGNVVFGHGERLDALTRAVLPNSLAEIKVEVEGGFAVCSRGRTLTLHNDAGRVEVVGAAAVRIDEIDRADHFVGLANGHAVGTDLENTQRRICRRQLSDVDRAVRVEDVVAEVAGNHFRGVAAVGNKVVENFVSREAMAVHLQTVNPDVAVVRADLHVLRVGLHPVIICGVRKRSGRYALKPDHGQLVFVAGLDADVQLDFAVLAIRDFDVGQLRAENRLLRLKFQANATRYASQELSVIVADVGSLEHDLDFLARGRGVVIEQASVKLNVGAALNHKAGDALCVDLKSAVDPIKIGAEGQRMIRAVAVLVAELLCGRLAVAVSGGIEVNGKAGRDRVDVIAERGTGDGDRRNDALAGADGEVDRADRSSTVRPRLDGAVNGQRGQGIVALQQTDSRRGAGGVIHHVIDASGGELLDFDCALIHRDNRRIVVRFRPDTDMAQVRSRDDFAARCDLKPRLDGVCAVRQLKRRGVNRRSDGAPRSGDFARKRLRAVHGHVDSLRALSGGCEAHSKYAGPVESKGAKIPRQIIGGHGDGPCEGLAIAVGVLNGELDRVRACGGEVLRNVEGAIALRHRLCSYLRPVDAPCCRAIAGGLFVGSIGGRPVEFDLDGRAVHHGERPRGQLIDNSDQGASVSAATSATAREWPQRADNDLVVSGHIQVAVLNIGVVNLALYGSFQVVEIFGELIDGCDGFRRVQKRLLRACGGFLRRVRGLCCRLCVGRCLRRLRFGLLRLSFGSFGGLQGLVGHTGCELGGGFGGLSCRSGAVCVALHSRLEGAEFHVIGFAFGRDKQEIVVLCFFKRRKISDSFVSHVLPPYG